MKPTRVLLSTLASAAALLLLLTAPASRAQTLYVGNGGNNTVGSFDLATGVATPGFTPISLGGIPNGLTLSGNALYATSSSGTLSAYNATTGAALAGFTPTVTGLSGPTGVAFSGGKLYVANTTGNSITTYNATTGAALGLYLSPSGLIQPIGLAISGGTLYVGNEGGGGSVRAFSLATWVAVPGFPISLSFPYGLTISGTALYATSINDNTLSAYDATTGAALPGFTTQTSANGLSFPWQVAAAGGNLYVANNTGNTITAYNATTGARDLSYISPSGLSGPVSIAISTPVPEPGSALLLLGGTALLALRRRRTGRA